MHAKDENKQPGAGGISTHGNDQLPMQPKKNTVGAKKIPLGLPQGVLYFTSTKTQQHHIFPIYNVTPQANIKTNINNTTAKSLGHPAPYCEKSLLKLCQGGSSCSKGRPGSSCRFFPFFFFPFTSIASPSVSSSLGPKR